MQRLESQTLQTLEGFAKASHADMYSRMVTGYETAHTIKLQQYVANAGTTYETPLGDYVRSCLASADHQGYAVGDLWGIWSFSLYNHLAEEGVDTTQYEPVNSYSGLSQKERSPYGLSNLGG